MNTEQNRRVPTKDSKRRVLAGVEVRDRDIEPTKGLTSVATLLRVMAGLLFLLMLMQLMLGFTSPVDISYGVLAADAVRLLIFAGLLWAAGDMANLFVKSHHDVRAMRILLARIAHSMGADPSMPTAAEVDRSSEPDDVRP